MIEEPVRRTRYPGSLSFSDTYVDRLTFRGRSHESQLLYHAIVGNDLVVLYGRSGMGKTSLLKAGVMSRLRERGLWPVVIRLNKPGTSLVALVREQIDLALPDGMEATTFDEDPQTIWEFLSGLELWRGQELLTPVLILDQFEELFTLGWPDAQRQEFITGFGAAIRGEPPPPRTGLVDHDSPAAVKYVISIREDALGELEALAVDLPQVMDERVRLTPLAEDQARAALKDPAAREESGLFETPAFTFTPDAEQAILDLLSDSGDDGGSETNIDPFQLQIVCQFVEEQIVAQSSDSQLGDPIVVTEAALGGPTGLRRILEDFYRRQLEPLDRRERRRARNLCERYLISPSGKRLSKEKTELLDSSRVSSETLAGLVKGRLLRSERRLDSEYIEITHDTMVKPIQAEATARRARRNKHLAWAGGAVVLVAVMVAVGAAIGASSRENPADPGPAPVAVEVGMPEPGEIIESGDVRVYSFEAEVVPIEVAVVPAADTTLDVEMNTLDPENETRIRNGGGAGEVERTVFNLPGSYEITVRGANSSVGNFEVRFDQIQPSDLALADVSRVEVSADIMSPGELDVFELDAVEGSAIVVTVTPTPASAEAVPPESEPAPLNAVVEVLDAEGKRTTVDNSVAGEARMITPSGPGPHHIVVGGFGPSIGSYTVGARKTSEVELDADGSPLGGQLNDSGDVKVYTLEIEGDDEVAVEVLPGADDLDLALQVTDPNASLRQVNSGANGESEYVLLSGAPGPYQIAVSAETPGEFTIGRQAFEVTPTRIGETPNGTIEDAGDVGVFDIDVGEGERLRLRGQPDGGLDLALEVIGPTGAVQRVNTGSTGAQETLALPRVEGTYRLRVSRSTDSSGSYGVTLTRDVEPDFNGDGYSDIVWSESAGADSSVWYANAGIRASEEFDQVPEPEARGGAFVPVTGDFNGDGYSDIFWSNRNVGGSFVWYGNAATATDSGEFDQVPEPEARGGAFVPVTGDFNGDGYSDILLSNRNRVGARFWYGNSATSTDAGKFDEAPADVDGAFVAVTSGDFNGDGYSDILWRNATGEARVSYGNTATFSDPELNAGGGVFDPVIGDFNGDGYSDIFWSNRNARESFVWYGNAGTSTGSEKFGVVSEDVQGHSPPITGDFDGDGYSDILWRNGTGVEFFVWYGNAATSTDSGEFDQVGEAFDPITSSTTTTTTSSPPSTTRPNPPPRTTTPSPLPQPPTNTTTTSSSTPTTTTTVPPTPPTNPTTTMAVPPTTPTVETAVTPVTAATTTT